MSKDQPKQDLRPPKWADRFLSFYCNPDVLEQIQGDVHELFYWRAEEKGATYAKRTFIWDVLRFFRWRNIRRKKPAYYHLNTIDMLKNYFKIGWRSLLKQKGTSFLNVFGLACAVACCLVAYLFIEGVWFKGKYHENKDELFLLTNTVEEETGFQRHGAVSAPLAQRIAQDVPDVKQTVRINIENPVINHKNESFRERTLFVDPQFMDMFTYTMEAGYSGALNEPHQVILTASVARKFFGDIHPIGQDLEILINGKPKQFVVGGVMEDLPSTAIFNFGVLVNNENMYVDYANSSLQEQWERGAWVFVQSEKDANHAKQQEALSRVLAKQQEIFPDDHYIDLQMEPLNTLVKNARSIEGGPVNYGSVAPQILLSAIAIFMLTLAIFNYINIAIVMATKRVKEIGVRKVIGGRKGQLVFQFLSENLIVCFMALLLGGLLASALFLPWFNNLASKNLEIDLLRNGNIWLFFAGLLVFVTVASGIYPSLYIASFKPVAIFTGKFKIGSKNRLTSALLTFQFVLAIITIVAGIAFVQTNNDNETRDWGYNQEAKFLVNVPEEADYLQLRDAFASHPNVVDMAGSRHMIGQGLNERKARYLEEDITVDVLMGAANYPDLMGLRLKEGRLFDPNLNTDPEQSIVVNQTFLDRLDLDFPVKNPVVLDSMEYTVIGVVEDFHVHFFTFSMDPLVIRASKDSAFNYLNLKLVAGSEAEMKEEVKEIWHETVANGLYAGMLQSDVFDDYFDDLNGVRNLLLFTSVLAIMLSAMGLFGLVSLNINARMKDFSIRKIMGAGLGELAKIIFKRYLILWLIAGTIGAALGSWAISGLLNSVFAFHSGVGPVTIITALLLLLLVIILTISSQVIKVKKDNPADTLKSE